jgi:hypothetical protein
MPWGPAGRPSAPQVWLSQRRAAGAALLAVAVAAHQERCELRTLNLFGKNQRDDNQNKNKNNMHNRRNETVLPFFVLIFPADSTNESSNMSLPPYPLLQKTYRQLTTRSSPTEGPTFKTGGRLISAPPSARQCGFWVHSGATPTSNPEHFPAVSDPLSGRLLLPCLCRSRQLCGHRGRCIATSSELRVNQTSGDATAIDE